MMNHAIKKTTGLFLILAIVCFHSSVYSQLGKPRLSINSGLSTPASEKFREFFKPGVNFGGGVEIPLPAISFSNTSFAIGASIEYNRFEPEDETKYGRFTDESANSIDFEGGENSILIVMLDFKLSRTLAASPKLHTYYVGGLGFIRTETEEIKLPQSSLPAEGPETRLALKVGSGVNFSLSDHIGIILEADLIASFNFSTINIGKKQNIIFFPVKAGINFGF